MNFQENICEILGVYFEYRYYMQINVMFRNATECLILLRSNNWIQNRMSESLMCIYNYKASEIQFYVSIMGYTFLALDIKILNKPCLLDSFFNETGKITKI